MVSHSPRRDIIPTIDRNEAKRRLDAIADTIAALPDDKVAMRFGAFHSPFEYTASAYSKAVRELLPWSQFELPNRRRIGHVGKNLIRVREHLDLYRANCRELITRGERRPEGEDWVLTKARTNLALAEQYDQVMKQAIHDLCELGKLVPPQSRRRR